MLHRQWRKYSIVPHIPIKALSHLLKMMAFELPPEPVLMVQPTGSGKSTVPLTCAIVTGGVTFIIENTLALASDQA